MDQVSQLLSQAQTQISVSILILDILLTALCASILARFYNRYGYSLSNKERLSRNFLTISVTTALIITIVKSSLALSLGLVGALSIVRFRSAIKEPEELAYLFLSIALGLGFGANQHVVTLVAFGIILAVLYVQRRMKETVSSNLYLSLSIPGKKKVDLNVLLSLLRKSCQRLDLKRIDQTKESFEASFYVEYKDIDELQKSLADLRSKYTRAEINLIDQSGMLV